MGDIITTILAKALIIALEALLARLFTQLVQTARYRRGLAPAAA